MFVGITANILRLHVTMDWKTSRVLFVGKVHKWYGRGIILVTQFVIGSGAVAFLRFLGHETAGWVIAGTSSGVFFTLLAIGEIVYQVRLRRTVDFVEPTVSMSAEVFQQALTNGRKLVILDELVLDVTKFIDQHPGGRFVLSHNIGRDISKFFYGGYSLEDNMGQKPASPYTHSTFARMIVNDLAIARYQPKIDYATTECIVR